MAKGSRIRGPSILDMQNLKMPSEFQQWLRDVADIAGHIETFSEITTDNSFTIVWQKSMASDSQFVGMVLSVSSDGTDFRAGSSMAGFNSISGSITGDILAGTVDTDDYATWAYESAGSGFGFGCGFLPGTNEITVYANGDTGKTVYHNGLILYSYMER